MRLEETRAETTRDGPVSMTRGNRGRPADAWSGGDRRSADRDSACFAPDKATNVAATGAYLTMSSDGQHGLDKPSRGIII